MLASGSHALCLTSAVQDRMMSLISCSGGLESAIQHTLPSSDLGKLHNLSPKSQDAVAIANLCQWKEWDAAE